MSYAKTFVDYIMSNKLKSFTHRDILLVTGTNCPHSVYKYGIKPKLIKKGLNIVSIEEENNNKRYKRYYIEEKDAGLH